MTGSEMRRALHSGERVYGSMIFGDSPRWARAVSGTGLDFVFLDSEHGPLDRGGLAWTCEHYSALGLVPVVRIPEPDAFEACKALDGGAQGVIAPYVESVQQVRDLVGAVRFRPLKGRRLHSRVAGEEALEPLLEDYLAARNEDRIAIVNIESRPALEALEEIVSVDGLDAVLIGPHDLSCNLGVPEQYDHPEFLAAVERIITTARSHGIGAGIHVVFDNSLDQEIAWVRMGANLVTHSVDVIAFRKTMRAEIELIKKAVGDR